MKNKYLPAETTLLESIGNSIRKVRRKQDISQEDLANICEIERGYMGRVERGEVNVSILKLKKIADALKIEISELLKTIGK
jgi:transcriptional regulator with XRE-family HTH domain